MSHNPKIIFFGSFLEYSLQTLQILHQDPNLDIIAVVTTPPNKDTKNPVHTWSDSQNLPVFTPEKLDDNSLNELKFGTWNLEFDISKERSIDLFLVAGYGNLLPASWLKFPAIAPINIHFSLLPKYRGAMPGEWAMLMDEKKTGVTLIEMSPTFDAGQMLAQQSTTIKPTDTRTSLYSHLYQIGGQLASKALPLYLEWKAGRQKELHVETLEPDRYHICLPPKTQPPKSPPPYARFIKKDDAFLPWHLINKLFRGETVLPPDFPPFFQELINYLCDQPSCVYDTEFSLNLIDRATRAFTDWPVLWTVAPTKKGDKRMKILSVDIIENPESILKDTLCLSLNRVQLEGHPESTFNQIKNLIN